MMWFSASLFKIKEKVALFASKVILSLSDMILFKFLGTLLINNENYLWTFSLNTMKIT
jgi:hypothetical protein